MYTKGARLIDNLPGARGALLALNRISLWTPLLAKQHWFQ